VSDSPVDGVGWRGMRWERVVHIVVCKGVVIVVVAGHHNGV